jgi:hypothetical protein
MKLVFCPYKILGYGTLCVHGMPVKLGSLCRLEEGLPNLVKKPFADVKSPWDEVLCAGYLAGRCQAYSMPLIIPFEEEDTENPVKRIPLGGP